MSSSRVSEVKKERRKTLYLREITQILRPLAVDEPAVAQVYVSNVELSQSNGILYIYFSAYMEPGEEIYEKALAVLKLYKPSIRKAFAQEVQARYTPELVFVYDKAKERERRVNDLLEKVSADLAGQK